MSSNLKNLSNHDQNSIPDAKDMKFGIVVAEWHSEITGALSKGAIDMLKKYGTKEKKIFVKYVPGSFELTLGAQLLAENCEVDAIICIGCVIRGETPHFDYICKSVTYGITELNLTYNLPVIFGVLTTENIEQAIQRAGGKHGNKGHEAAVSAIKMAALKKEIELSSGR